MVGFKQLEEGDGMPKHLRSLEGVKVPLYYFGIQTLMDHEPAEDKSRFPESDESMLNALLLAQWEDRAVKGIFQYDVMNSEIKSVEGRKKFVAQLNEGWDADHLKMSEENSAFNQADVFELSSTKLKEELLFCVASSKNPAPEIICSAAVPDNGLLIFINVSPVEYGHVLLVPFRSDSFYQFLDARCLEMAVEVSVGINNCCFRLFYDCSPDMSNLHFQACYFPNPLAVELRSVDTIYGDLGSGMHIAIVKDYPVNTLLFESNHKLKNMMEVISKICSFLQQKGITYNLLISDSGKKIFIFLQQQNLKKSGFLSAWECGGYFLYKSRSEFDQATETTMLSRLSSVSLDEEAFKAVKTRCCTIAKKYDLLTSAGLIKVI